MQKLRAAMRSYIREEVTPFVDDDEQRDSHHKTQLSLVLSHKKHCGCFTDTVYSLLLRCTLWSFICCYTMSSLTSMPFDVLQRILLFVSDPIDFRHCELTGKTLHQVVADQETWSHCDSVEDIRLSHRERAFVCRVFDWIQKEQMSKENIIVTALGVQGFKELVIAVLNQFLPADLYHHTFYFLRGDTTAYLAELVQSTLIWQFQRANLICCQTCPEDTYPVLTHPHLQLQDTLVDPLLEEGGAQRLVPCYDGSEVIPFANTLIPLGVRDKIIRRIARRAGAVKMANEVFDFAWGSVVQLTAKLMQPVCMILHHVCSEDSSPKRVLGPLETIHTVPPRSCSRICDCCGDPMFTHTPVPKQIEEAARKLYIPSKVYGNFWLAVEGSTTKEEMEEAEAEYLYAEDCDPQSEAGNVALEDEDSLDEEYFTDDQSSSDFDSIESDSE